MSGFKGSVRNGPERRISLEDRMEKQQEEIRRYQEQVEEVHPKQREGVAVDRGNVSFAPKEHKRPVGTEKPETRKSKVSKMRSNQAEEDTVITLMEIAEREKKRVSMASKREEEAGVVTRVRERIKQIFGERIINEEKDIRFQAEIREAIENALMDEGRYVATVTERTRLMKRIYNLIMGFGPLEDLFGLGYSEIMVARYDKVFVEEKGKMKRTEIQFSSEAELRGIIEQMVSRIGRVVNEMTPLVDGRLEDGSRFNVTIPPIAVDGAQLTIRRFPEKKLTESDYIQFDTLDEKTLWFLKKAVEAKWNLIVSGGTGSGKTSLLNLLSNFLAYDSGLSVVTIEDSCELQINHPNVRRYETRAANAAGAGEVTSRMLVKNLMRVRPDVAIIGEIRDGTMADFLRLNTSGHEGGMTTVHNNSPEELESTIQVLFQMAKDYNFTENAISRLYANAVDLIVQIKRYKDHVRRVSHISHVVGYGKLGAKRLKIPYDSPEYSPDEVYIRDIFVWEQEGIGENGKFTGKFKATGYVPEELIEKALTNGVVMDQSIFAHENPMKEGGE